MATLQELIDAAGGNLTPDQIVAQLSQASKAVQAAKVPYTPAPMPPPVYSPAPPPIPAGGFTPPPQRVIPPFTPPQQAAGISQTGRMPTPTATPMALGPTLRNVPQPQAIPRPGATPQPMRYQGPELQRAYEGWRAQQPPATQVQLPQYPFAAPFTGRDIAQGTALAGMGLLAAVQPELIPVMAAFAGLSSSAQLPAPWNIPGRAVNAPFQAIETGVGKVVPEETGIPLAASLAVPLALGAGAKYAAPKVGALAENIPRWGKAYMERQDVHPVVRRELRLIDPEITRYGGTTEELAASGRFSGLQDAIKYRDSLRRGSREWELANNTVAKEADAARVIGHRFPEAQAMTEEAPKVPEPPKAPAPSEVLPLTLDAPPTEQFTQTVNRLYHGALDAFGIRALDEYAQLGKIAKEAKLPSVEYNRMNGTYGLSSKPNEPGLAVIKALRNEGEVPAGYESYYEGVRKLYAKEEADMAGFPAELAFIDEPYSHIQYKLIPGPEQAKGGRAKPGTTPAFLKQRGGKTIEENLAWEGKNGERLELSTYDPGKFVLARRMAGEEYRQSKVLVERWKSAPSNELLDLRRAVPQKEAPRDWRVPSIPAFSREGLAVSPKDYAYIDKMFPLSSAPSTKLGTFMNKLQQNVRLSKVFLSPQQYIDLTTRGLGHAIGSNRVGDVPPAMMSLTRWISPKARAAFDHYIATDADMQLMTEQGLSLRAGQELASRSILSEIKGEDILGMPFIKEIPVPERLKYVKAVKDRANGAAEFLQSGLYDYVYSGNMAAAAKGELAGMKSLHPDWTPAAQAAEASKNLNIRFSSIPDWQSMLTQAPGGRQFYRNLMFGPVENEGLVRSWTQWLQPFGRGKASQLLFFRYDAGMFLMNFMMAEMLNKAFTGDWLDPEDQLTPFKTGQGALGVGMNSHFMRPMLPWKGPNNENQYLDLLGQQDTIFRWLDPEQALRSRLNILPGALYAENEGQTYFGKPLQMPVGEGWQDKLRNQLQFGLETISPMGAAALLPGSSEAPIIGKKSAALQLGGINVSAEGLGQMRDRKAVELGVKLGLTGKDEVRDYKGATAYIRAQVEADPDIVAKVELNRGKTQARIGAGIAGVDETAYEQLRVANDIYNEAIQAAVPLYLADPQTAESMVRAARDDRFAQRALAEKTFPQLAKGREDFKVPTTAITEWTPQEVYNYEMSLYSSAKDKNGKIMPQMKDDLYDKIDTFESVLTPIQFAQLQADLGAKDTPVMALRRQFVNMVAQPKYEFAGLPGKVGYYDIHEAVWQKVRKANFPDFPPLSYYEFQRWLIVNNTDMAPDEVLQNSPVVKAVDDAATTYRQALEEEVPLITAIQVAFGMKGQPREDQEKVVMPLVANIKEGIAAALQGEPK